MRANESTRRDLTPQGGTWAARIKQARAMTTVGLLVSVTYVAWVGLFILSTNDLA